MASTPQRSSRKKMRYEADADYTNETEVIIPTPSIDLVLQNLATSALATAATESDDVEETTEGVTSSTSATLAAIEKAAEDHSESSEDEEEDSTDSDEWDKKRRKMQMRARRQRVQKWKINNNSQTKQQKQSTEQARCGVVQKKVPKAINEAMACSSGTSVVMSNNNSSNNIEMSGVPKSPRNLAEMRQYTNVPKAINEPMACSSGTSVVMSNNNNNSSNNIEMSGVAKTPRNLAEMLQYTNVVSANLGKKSSLLTPSNAGSSSVGTAAAAPRLPPPSKSIATLITDRFRPNRLSFYGRTSFPTPTPRAVPVHTIRLSNNVNAQGRSPSTTTFDATLGDVVARQMTQMPSLVPAIVTRPNATTSFWPTPSSSTNAQHNLLLAASADGETAALLDDIGSGATKQNAGYRGGGTSLVEEDVVVLDSDEEEENSGTGAATAADHLQQQDNAESAPFCKNCFSEIPLILQSLDRLDGIVTLMTSAVETELRNRRRISSQMEPAATKSNAAAAAITTTTSANQMNVPAASSSYLYTVQTQTLDQQLSKLNGGIGGDDGIQLRLLQSSSTALPENILDEGCCSPQLAVQNEGKKER